MISLTFIWHDCFLLQTPEAAIVFDFWKDGRCRAASPELPKFLNLIDAHTPLYVLVSHHHKDHFNRSIFSWETVHPNIRYIISEDTRRSVGHLFRAESIYTGFKPSREKITVLQPGDSFRDSLLSVKAFGSTDIGNSYLLTLPDKRTVFHAGDLNAWVWKDESTSEEIEEALNNFSAILDKITLEAPQINIALFPVDSRLGRDYWEGASMFVRAIDVEHFFPMHFCLAESDEELSERIIAASKFQHYANPIHGDYIALTSPYSSFATS